MNRKSGGLIGKKVTPSGEGAAASASGIWNLQDVVDSETSGIYPQPDVPPNAADIVANVTLEVLETKTLAVTFSGASDPDGDTVFDWTITEGSGALSLTPSSFTGVSSAATTFTAGNVSADTAVDITVTVTDQYGLSASKVLPLTIKNNIAPVATAITSNPSTIEFAQSSSGNNVTFTNASDSEDGTTLDWSVSIVDTTYITGVTAVGDVTDVSSATFAFTTGSAGGSDRTGQRFDVTVTDSVGATDTKQFSMAVKAATALTISSNVNNYNIASAVTGAGGSLNSNVNLTINSGVTVGSSTTSTAAMLTGTGWGSGTTINITNNGSIVGSAGTDDNGTGGSGGSGGRRNDWTYPNGSGGSAGSGSAGSVNNGGDAFEHSQTADNNLAVVFDTTGTRTAGSAGTRTFLGGGGGGGVGAPSNQCGTQLTGGCGGGGAANGGRGYSYCQGGSTGGATTGGSGGGGAGSGGGYAGNGGTGGDLGEAGTAGTNGYSTCYGWYTSSGTGGGAGSTGTANGSAGVVLSGNTGQIS